MTEEKLSELNIISEVDALKAKVEELGQGNSTLLKIAQESFIIGSKSHLNSLNPEIREELFNTARPKIKVFLHRKKEQIFKFR